MNVIEFKQLRAKNVLSIGQEILLDYTATKGLVYVVGHNRDTGAKNGAGKSAILVMCILIALYGKTINNTKNEYLYNRQASWKEGGFIELDFTKNTAEDYKIYVDVKVPKTRAHCSLNYTLYRNGENITKATKAETLDYIENQIIGCSFDVFKSTVIMSSSNLMNFFEMPRHIKTRYLHGVFSLNHFEDAYNLANSTLNTLKSKIKQLSQLRTTIDANTDDIKEQHESWNKTHLLDIDRLTESLYKEQQLLENVSVDIKEPESYNKKCKFISMLGSIKKSRQELKHALAVIGKELVDIESSIKCNKLLLDKNKPLIDCICKSCQEKVKSLFKLNEAIASITEAESRAIKKRAEQAELNAKIDKLDAAIEKSASVQAEVSEYKSAIVQLENSKKSISRNIESLTEQLERIKNQSNPYISLLETNLTKVKELDTNINKMGNSSVYYGLVKEIFSDEGVKAHIIQNIITILNKAIHNYLGQMGADFLVHFNSKFEYDFYTPTGPCDYSSFSAGERRKLDLAVLLAFRDVLTHASLRTNICIVDEILDSSIDSATLDAVIAILKTKSSMDNQSFYIITHREGLSESEVFNHCLTIEKENGSSKITQTY